MKNILNLAVQVATEGPDLSKGPQLAIICGSSGIACPSRQEQPYYHGFSIGCEDLVLLEFV